MKIFLRISFPLILLIACFGMPQAGHAQTGTVVRVEPSSLAVEPGESFTVVIIVENVVDLYGFEISVQYDPDLLTVVSVELGGFLKEGLSFFNIDEDAGIVNFLNSQTAPAEPQSGTGTLVTIHLLAGFIDGVSQIKILEPEGMPIFSDKDGFEIPCDVEYGSVTVEDVFYTFLPLVVK